MKDQRHLPDGRPVDRRPARKDPDHVRPDRPDRPGSETHPGKHRPPRSGDQG